MLLPPTQAWAAYPTGVCQVCADSSCLLCAGQASKRHIQPGSTWAGTSEAEVHSSTVSAGVRCTCRTGLHRLCRRPGWASMSAAALATANGANKLWWCCRGLQLSHRRRTSSISRGSRQASSRKESRRNQGSRTDTATPAGVPACFSNSSSSCWCLSACRQCHVPAAAPTPNEPSCRQPASAQQPAPIAQQCCQ